MARNGILEQLAGAYLENIGRPLGEAYRLAGRYGPTDFKDMRTLAEAEGFIVRYTSDLPKKLGGCAYIVDEREYIAVNSEKSRLHQEASIAHEMGHHILGHVRNPSRWKGKDDFQANLFAFGIAFRTLPGEDRQTYPDQNRDIGKSVLLLFMPVAGLILAASGMKSVSRVFGLRRSLQGEKK